MNKKIKILIIFIVILFSLFIIFNKFFISHFILKNLSSWTERTVTAKSVDIEYSNGLINFIDLEILNKPDFYDKNIFEAKKLIIEIELSTLLSGLIIIKQFTLHEPRFFFEIKDLSKKLNSKKEITKDNIGLVDKIIGQTSPKIYPTKKKLGKRLVKLLNQL